MKRKVKFQEGGAVEEPARRSAISNEPVGADLRRLFAARPAGPRGPVNREVGGPREQEDRARMAAEAAAQFDAEERALAERRAAQRAALTNQPSRITNRPVGGAMFGGPAASMPTPAAAPALAMRRAMDAEGSEVAADAERRRQEANRPAPRSRPAAAPREISADRLNDLAMGAEPANVEERLAQMRMQARRQELEERGTAFKKGGMVKPAVKKKAGGMIAAKPKAAPKKMMKGGMTAMPKPTVRSKSKSKPMPFKKGGKISMKGKK